MDVELGQTLQDYEDFVGLNVVREEIEVAKEEKSGTAVKRILASIIQEGGPADYETVAERIGHSAGTIHVSAATTELETHKIVSEDRRDNGMWVTSTPMALRRFGRPLRRGSGPRS